MAKEYKYIYKTSDGVRHEAMISAASRQDVFTILRAQKIRPIKVLAADGSLDNGAVNGVRKRVVTAVVVVVAISVGGIAYWLGHGLSQSVSQQMVSIIARPLARQQIQGERHKIVYAQYRGLDSPVARYLSFFAEPGRELPASAEERPTDDAFLSFLAKEVCYEATDFSEIIDLKRILQKIRLDMKAYLNAGGTISGYCDGLVKRQELEKSYRDKAEKQLNELLVELTDKDMMPAYDYFLRANAQLQSMGIYPIPPPYQLRPCQQSIDLD